LAPAGPIRDGLLDAYTNGFNKVFYMLAATSSVAFAVSFGMGWVDLRTKVQQPKGGNR